MSAVVGLSASPILQFFNNAGQPNAGGTLLTQVGGVNYQTYQDAAGATALPNPIPLNSRGEISNSSGVSSQLFLVEGVAYTFTLYDANGNQLNQATSVEAFGAGVGVSYVTDISALKALSGMAAGAVVETQGYYTAGDGGAGTYWWNSTDTTADNGGTVIAPNAGGTGRWNLLVIGAIYNVRKFGATGNGTTDDTAFIQAAWAAVKAAIISGNSGIFGSYAPVTGTAPTLFFPSGVYKVSGGITADVANTVIYCLISGDNAIINATGLAVPVIGGVGTNVSISGLIFRGGLSHISIKTGNTDNSVINIDYCEFDGQTGASIETDNNSNSTLLTISRSKFRNDNTGSSVLNLVTCDLADFNDCWVETSSYAPFIVGSASTFAALNINNMLGVPLTGGPTQSWVTNYGITRINKSRLGGENGGCIAVTNQAALQTGTGAASGVVIRDCEAYTPINTPLVALYRLPNLLEIDGITGLTAAGGTIYVDAGAGVTADINAGYGPTFAKCVINGVARDVLRFSEAQSNSLYPYLSSNTFEDLTPISLIDMGYVINQIDPLDTTGYGYTVTETDTSTIGVGSLFGNSWLGIRGTGAGANVGVFIKSYTTALASGYTNGNVYTLSVPVFNFSLYVQRVLLGANGITKPFHVGSGWTVLNLPFVYNTSLTNEVLIAFYNVPANSFYFQVGAFRLLSTAMKLVTPNLCVWSTSLPTGGYWMRGDDIVNNPNASASPGWVCTISGTGGGTAVFKTKATLGA